MEAFAVFLLVASSAAFPAEFSGSASVSLGGNADISGQANFTSAVGGLNVTYLRRDSISSSLIPIRTKGREQAVLEQPSAIEKADSLYDYPQQAVITFLHPKPIIDNISEKDKYGNTGAQFRPVGNAIVEGYGGFSNFINAAADFPFQAMKQVTKQANHYLSALGAKLVGL